MTSFSDRKCAKTGQPMILPPSNLTHKTRGSPFIPVSVVFHHGKIPTCYRLYLPPTSNSYTADPPQSRHAWSPQRVHFSTDFPKNASSDTQTHKYTKVVPAQWNEPSWHINQSVNQHRHKNWPGYEIYRWFLCCNRDLSTLLESSLFLCSTIDQSIYPAI